MNARTRLRNAKKQLSRCVDSNTSRALELRLRIERLKIVVTMEKAGFPDKIVASFNRIQRVKDTIQVIDFKMVELTSFTAGSNGQVLGQRATTPCDIQVEMKVAKRLQKERLGPRPGRSYICHRCDEPLCAALDHLFWGTAVDNARDCALKNRHGRQRPGQFSTPEAYVAHHTARLIAKRARLEKKLP